MNKWLDKYQDGGQISDMLLLKQAWQESSFRPKIKNRLGFMGLGQVGKATIKDYKKAKKLKSFDPYDIKQAKDIQKWYMNDLYNSSFANNPNQSEEVRMAKALSAYNYGRGNLVNILSAEKKKGTDIYNSLEWTKKLPKETRQYLDRILLKKDEQFNKEFDSVIQLPKYKNIVDKYLPKEQTPKELTPWEEGLKEKWLDQQKFQDGRSIDLPIQKIDTISSKQFILDYINSPKYKERLKSSGYKDVDNEIEARKYNIEDTRIKYIGDDLLDAINKPSIKGVGSYHDFYSNTAYIDKNEVKNINSIELPNPSSEESVEAHELSHSEINIPNITKLRPMLTNPKILEMPNRLNKGDRVILESMLINKEADVHDKNAGENKADLNSFRYELFRDNIYDAGKQEFSKEHLKKSKNSFTKDRLLKNFGKDNLIILMNNIAFNDNNKNNLNIASDGGVIKDNRGQWEHPGEITEIDSNQITMKGVLEPLVGISDTGHIQYMEPNKNYKFEGNKVTEYPLNNKRQNGGWLDKY